MTDRRPFDTDPEIGSTETFHYDEQTGEFFIETEQDVTESVKHSKEMYANCDGRRWDKGVLGGDKVASIPLLIWQELEAKGIANDPKALKAWLNDPDNRAFRVRPGKV
jgi:hypothetical protein